MTKSRLALKKILLIFSIVFSLATLAMFFVFLGLSSNPQEQTEIFIVKNKVIFIIFFTVFFAVDIFLWLYTIWYLLKPLRDKKVLENGEICSATYISSFAGIKINGYPYYKIIYSCRLKTGEIKKFKTANEYTFSEVRALGEMKTFKVKVYKNKSVIVEDLENIQELSHTSVLMESYATDEVYLRNKCEYCGGVYEDGETKCPNCGANLK